MKDLIKGVDAMDDFIFIYYPILVVMTCHTQYNAINYNNK